MPIHGADGTPTYERKAYMEETPRLYGEPDAESLYLHINDVVDRLINDVDDDQVGPWQIEEWTAKPLSSEMPAAVWLIEWTTEHIADEAPENAYERVRDLDKDPDVLAAAEVFLAVVAPKLDGYWLAEKRVATHLLTLGSDRAPYIDGERVYLRSVAP